MATTKRKIRALREALGLSIAKTSQAAAINVTTLCQSELGKVAASPAVQKALAKFYGEPVDTLFDSVGMAK